MARFCCPTPTGGAPPSRSGWICGAQERPGLAAHLANRPSCRLPCGAGRINVGLRELPRSGLPELPQGKGPIERGNHEKAKMAAVVASSALIATLGLFGCSSGGGESSEPAADRGRRKRQRGGRRPRGSGGRRRTSFPLTARSSSLLRWASGCAPRSIRRKTTPITVIYYRFTGVDDDPSNIQAAIDAYNNSDSIYYIDELDARRCPEPDNGIRHGIVRDLHSRGCPA